MIVKQSELSNTKMIAGNDEKYPIVIKYGDRIDWIKIGWIPVGKATEEDYIKYPEVEVI